MTDLKFTILKLLYNSYPLREQAFGEILKSIPANPILVKNSLNELKSKGIIKLMPGSNIFKLTTSGAELFEQIQEERHKASKHECQQRFDNKISVASALVPFVTFILGLLVDHYTSLTSFILSVFR